MVEKVTAADTAAAATKYKAGSAYLALNKTTGAMHLSVPQGTKLVDALKSLSAVDLSAVARLPRGCQACLSGHAFDIRERFDPVINVTLGH